MTSRTARGGTLVLGGGFAGAYVARLLGKRGATIVSPQNSMLYTPLLPEAASGTLEPRHVVVPLRQMCPHAELVLGRVVAVDTGARTVAADTIAGSAEISYERLVMALGAVTRVFPVPGLVEHGRGFKDLADAIALRNHVLQRLEAAAAGGPPAELGFVFVGAGYAGVEALAELNDLARAALRYYPSLRDTPQRWVIVDAAPTILADIPRRLGTYAARRLERRGIEIHVGETLSSYDGETAVLSDGTTVPARTLVWTAGVKASPLLGDLGLPLDDRGRVRVDATLRVEGLGDVWALGDCAAVPNIRTPGRTDPPTCQHALRQARRLAKNLEGEPRPYGYRMLGQVATLGRYKGIADVMGIHLSGFLGWFVARTYHLYALPLLSRKLRVVTDWTTSLFFRRDIAELSSLGHPGGLDP
jgi:NADH:ubiquinone reductase (H+-translocating)